MHILKVKDITNRDFDLKIVDWERPLLPDLHDEYKEITGKDGLRHVPKEMGNQPLRIQFFRQNSSPQEWFTIRKKIAEWLFSRNEIKIEVDDEPSTYFIGKLASADLPENYKPSVSFWVEFSCHPVRYGKEVTTSDKEFTYEGTYDMTPLKITLENVSTNELVVSVNGVEIKYKDRLSSATVTIDSKELELRVNGDLKVFEVEGYFPFLKPGNIEIDVNAGTTITAEYTEMFL